LDKQLIFVLMLFLIINNFWNSNMQKIKEKWSDVRRVGFVLVCMVFAWSFMANAVTMPPEPLKPIIVLPGALTPVTTPPKTVYIPRLKQLYQNPLTILSITQDMDGPNYNRAEYAMISSQPTALWFSKWNPGSVRREVADYVGRAASVGQVPVMVIYNIYKRDCTSASDGGAEPGDAPGSNQNEDAALANYKNYISEFSNGIKDGLAFSIDPKLSVMILLEPDSLGLQTKAPINGVAQNGSDDCADFSPEYHGGTKTQVLFSNAKRNETLKWSVNQLASAACFNGSTCPSYLSHVKVYLDGTHSGWGGWESIANGYLVQAIIDAGIRDAAGVFTNVSNYQRLGDPLDTNHRANELVYGRWLLEQVKRKMGGWGTYSCSGGQCNIPDKRQVIDVARIGANMNLSSSEDQGNGWSGWCDNRKALVGPPPTLYVGDIAGIGDFTQANWVDALLWVKPAGETDGCFGNGKTDHNIARGVPNREAPGNVKAGTFSYDNACMLLHGSPGFDLNGNPILNDCEPIKDIAAAVASPTNLRIAAVETNALFPQILLEWKPSAGACHYRVLSRVGTTGKFQPVLRTYGNRSNGPASRVVVSPGLVGKAWRTGETVQYAVVARNCGETPVWSALSNIVTTHDFP
jgi:Glycosyl hydrolases family 6